MTVPLPWQGSASLSQLFIKFLEAESTPPQTPASPTIPSSVVGYVDPRTDPDRPSLATAAIVGRPPPRHSHPHPSTASSGQGDNHLPLHTSLPTFQTPQKSVTPEVLSSSIVNLKPPPISRPHSGPTHAPVTITGTGTVSPVPKHVNDDQPSDHIHRHHPALASRTDLTPMPYSASPSTSYPSATSNRRTDSSNLFMFSPIHQGERTHSFQSSLLKNVLSD